MANSPDQVFSEDLFASQEESEDLNKDLEHTTKPCQAKHPEENIELNDEPETESGEPKTHSENPSPQNNENTDQQGQIPEKLIHLPLARIKGIIKLDPDVNLVSADAVFAITKATELFIESLAKECYVHTSQAKKKTVQRKDLDAAISTVDQLIFLEGAIV